LPHAMRNECEYINHYSHTNDFVKNMTCAQNLLDNYYNNARVVITTFLHCALPCIAMGIPVIVFYPNHKKPYSIKFLIPALEKKQHLTTQAIDRDSLHSKQW
jgi:hypothetical protein